MPAASSSNKAQGASNLNRRSQSFNSIDKNKPPNYANGNEKGKCVPVMSSCPEPNACLVNWHTMLLIVDQWSSSGAGMLSEVSQSPPS